jgi:hypothetical protein
MIFVLNPLKGSSKDPQDYPYRIELVRIMGNQYDLTYDIIEGINQCEGCVGALFQEINGMVTYELAFGNPNDAMLFKLKFQK